MKKAFIPFVLFFCLCVIAQARQLTVATYNMRNDNVGNPDAANGDGWQRRLPVITDLIRFHDFDIFGTQECLKHQLENVKAGLPGYDYIGKGRDDGKDAGEFSAIFYKTTTFKLLKHGDFWMSTITDRPNKGWDAALPRICSWGEFQVIGTTFRFRIFNLHMDHVGVEARKESAKLILTKIKEMPGNMPVILTGDFNVDQNNESYTLLNSSGVLVDAFDKAEIRYTPNGTFNAFKSNLKTESRIDHIFLTKEFKVKRYGILPDIYWAETSESKDKVKEGDFPKEVSSQKYSPRMPSDHFPVMIRMEY